MQTSYEHLEYGVTTNRTGEKVYFARIYYKKQIITENTYKEIVCVETLINKSFKELGKEARTRYRFYYPKKAPGRTPRAYISTYNGRNVIMYPKKRTTTTS